MDAGKVYVIIGALLSEYSEQFEVEKALAGDDMNALQIIISQSEILCEFVQEFTKRFESEITV